MAVPRSGQTKRTTIAIIAQLLRSRRSVNQPTLLFLGSHTGGLYGNEGLYQFLEAHCSPAFSTLAADEKFGECHTALQGMNPSNRLTWLKASLREAEIPVSLKTAYAELAELLKEGFFSTIISTNLDALLEDALRDARLEETHGYQVRIHGLDSNEDIIRAKGLSAIQIFGSVRREKCTLNLDLDDDPYLKKYLEELLEGEALVLGYDPVWDEPLERAFSGRNHDLIYVDATPPNPGSPLAKTLEKRQGSYLDGAEAEFCHFIHALHESLLGQPAVRPVTVKPGPAPKAQDAPEIASPSGRTITEQNASNKTKPATPLEDETTLKVPSNREGEAKRTKIFISYSREDSKYLDALLKHLNFLKDKGLIAEIWHDRDILPGAVWMKEIEQALTSAKVAIFLVSSDFLSSDSINQIELPPLLKAAYEGKVTLISVIVRPCEFTYSDLKPFRAINDPSFPISALRPHEQEKVWLEVAERVMDLYAGK
ncbi:toll/interleukin-1 receptor domain-containing protein [Ktedonosporobacter rubrisoli]|uniref:Toll/interleukin-1 receptor domain-containing protein n=1 Tax=Ktedonosporobacter rubrisoli TaxID=2509675 RepID=A0A4P6JW67_KTERU|nr:toll/interleukin-1 receptor domain-containing protein [Ktedonosporobacter rubrisoli]QBD79927.1 toll/interleukin-1 receptor domain-containing protein [Ktedonosporobacter rubrisoli]